MQRISLPLVALAFLAALGCDRIIGREALRPADGPLEGNTEVSIYVADCGDHRQVKKVLFDTVPQAIVSQKEDEVKIRTASANEPGNAAVKLVLTNNRTCDTGVTFMYQKMEQQTINYLLDQGHPMGERRVGGWRPGNEPVPSAGSEETP